MTPYLVAIRTGQRLTSGPGIFGLLVYGLFIQKRSKPDKVDTREIDPPFGDNYL